MTVTIQLPPDRETRLRERAAQQGKEVSDYLLDMADPEGAASIETPMRPPSEYISEAAYVAEAVRMAVAHGQDPVTAAAIAQGIADGEAGREQSFEEFTAEMRATRLARKTARLSA